MPYFVLAFCCSLTFKIEVFSENSTYRIMQIYVEVCEKLLVLGVSVPLISRPPKNTVLACCAGSGAGGRDLIPTSSVKILLSLCVGAEGARALPWAPAHSLVCDQCLVGNTLKMLLTVPSGILGEVSARGWCQPLSPLEGLLTWYSPSCRISEAQRFPLVALTAWAFKSKFIRLQCRDCSCYGPRA